MRLYFDVDVSPGHGVGGNFSVYTNDFTDVVRGDDPGANFSEEVEPGTYNVLLNFDIENETATRDQMYLNFADVVVDGDVEKHVAMPIFPVTVNVVDPDGDEIDAERQLECRQGTGESLTDYRLLRSEANNWAEHVVWGMAVDTSSGDGSACTLEVVDNSNNEVGLHYYQDVTLNPEGPNEITVVMPPPGMVTLSGQLTQPTGTRTAGYVAAYDQTRSLRRGRPSG